MASIINASTSTGLVTTADTSGVLQLQTGGTTAVSIGTDQSFNFSATGQRITGDFSNATIANRVAFQTSTANGNTGVYFLPNGTATTSNVIVSNASDPTNSALGIFGAISSDIRISSAISGTGTYLPMTFYTGGSERVRVDTSGNVGIGTTSPNSRLDVSGTSPVISVTPGAQNQTTAIDLRVLNSGTYGAARIAATNASTYDSNLLFYTNTSSSTTLVERMRIDSSGNLLVGTTSPIFTTTKLQVTNSTTQTVGLQQTGGAANACVTSWNTATSGTIYQISFADGASGLVRGSITTNGTGTTYGTASDYRLKENIQPMTGALSVVQQLNPVTYNWKADGSDGQGFIAHELQAVCPDAVTGEKDAVDAEGNPVYQGIDTSFLVATLTAAIKEQQAIIQTLTDRITALEGTTP